MRKSDRANDRGQALVEFALVFPIFILVVVAVFDLGSAVFSYNSVTNAAREGARTAVVNQDVATIIARAKAQTAIAEIDEPAVTVQFYQAGADGSPDTGRPCMPYIATGCLAVVGFQTTYHPITPLISSLMFSTGVTFHSKTVMAVEYSCPNPSVPNAADCPRH